MILVIEFDGDHSRLHCLCFASRRAAIEDVINWMSFYNHRRLYSTLAYVNPMQFRSSAGSPIKKSEPLGGLGYGLRNTEAVSFDAASA